MHVVRHVYQGWSISSLDSSCSEIGQRVSLLDPPQLDPSLGCFVWEKCGCQLHRPTLMTADAGQAYESIDTPVIFNTSNDLF